MSRRTRATCLLNLAYLSLALAQAPAPGNTANIASSIFGAATATPTSSTTGTASATTTANPTDTTATDSPTPSDGSVPSIQRDGLVRVYFIFIALVVVVAMLGSFLYYRRRRQLRALAQDTNNRQSALAQDLRDWDPARGRRRYWQGRWRSDHSAVVEEEGLNEHGEAPPPYVPKANAEGPAIPLGTLSREEAGLKPPDYEEGEGQTGGGGGGGGSRAATRGQTPRP